jgi:hypothetical protein
MQTEVIDKVVEIKADKKEEHGGQPIFTIIKNHTFIWSLISINEGVVI